MATRGYIAIKENDEPRAIYHHWDSYPSYLGKLLLEHYSNIDKIKEAISYGDASFWDKNISPPKNATHNYENKYPNTSVFYHRDRNQDLHIGHFLSTNQMIMSAFRNAIEYLYLFDIDKNRWLVTRPYYNSYTGDISNFIDL